MKTISFVACALMLIASTAAPSEKPDAQQSSAQAAFARLKTLAGTWKGVAAMGPQPGMSAPVRVSLRVTSGGSAILHEMVPEGRSDDPTRGEDDPITVIYVEGDRLMLTHYCDTGDNRPRMVGTLSPDGKSIKFELVDVSGGKRHGYMNGAVFTMIDANHHTEDWASMSPDDKSVQAHIDLARTK